MTEEEFILAQVTAIELQIIALNTAILTSVGGAVSYTFDDGQTRQTVTRASISEARILYNSLLNLRSTLLAQLGRGQVYVRPSF